MIKNQSSTQSYKHVFEVSELNQKIKQLLEDSFPFIWISGEISNFRRPLSGHCYFTLKDASSQINCVLFRHQAESLKFKIADGLSIIGLGRIGVYKPRGTYQIIFEYLDPKGIGGLQIAFEKLKKKLFEEGLFESQHKKALPSLPRKISIVTSPTGAAVHDFLKVALRRLPNLHIEVVAARVQGEHAASELIHAIKHLNESAHTDMIVLARGGGSIEDLFAFNDEDLARAIFSSKLPVVSAVGHETDFTIADFVADLRAPTPSAAAEIVVPLKKALNDKIQIIREKLNQSINIYLKLNKKNLDGLSMRIVHPKRRVQDMRVRLDDYSTRLCATMKVALTYKKECVVHGQSMLMSLSPAKNINMMKKDLIRHRFFLINQLEQQLREGRQTINHFQTTLDTLNPMAVLQRGYSITRTLSEHLIVRSAKQVDFDQHLEILLGNGKLNVTVNERITE